MSSSKTSVLEPRAQPSPADGAGAAKRSGGVRIAVIGYGYWGPNIVRNLHAVENCEVVKICDKSPAALKRAHQVYPGIELTTDLSEVLRSRDVDAVAVITPVWTHY